MVSKRVQTVVLIVIVTIFAFFAARQYLNVRAKAAGIEAWIPVLKLPNGEIAKDLLAVENSRHLFVKTENGKLYALWSDEQGGYPTVWSHEETLPEGEDAFGYCVKFQPKIENFAIEAAPEESIPIVKCTHIILHSGTHCKSVFALSHLRNVYTWSKCEGSSFYYFFDYYLPRISAASCLQKGASKC